MQISSSTAKQCNCISISWRFPSQYSEKYEGKLEGIPTTAKQCNCISISWRFPSQYSEKYEGKLECIPT